MNTAGEDNRTITVRIAIELAAASTPTLKSVGITYIDITWSQYAHSNYVISYEICVKTSDQGDCVLKLETENTEYLIENLQGDTTYRISIVVVTEFGRTPASEILTVGTHNPGLFHIPPLICYILI